MKRDEMKNKRIVNIVLIVLIGLLVMLFAYVNIVQYKQGLNADVASDGVLASVLWESKEWVPEEWYVASETRLIGIANIASLFYGATHNICLSMGFACVVGMLLILYSAWNMCKELNFESTQSLLFLFLVLLVPNNKQQLELMYIFAAYYSVHIATYFMTLTLYLRLLKTKKCSNVFMFFLLCLHFLLGAQGVRGILMITGPLMVGELIRRAYLWWCGTKWNKEENRVTIYTIVLNIMGLVGGLLPVSIGIPMSRNMRKAPEKLVGVVLPDFFLSFEWNNISFLEKIAFIFGFVVILVLFLKVIQKGMFKKDISGDEWVFLNFIFSVFLTIMALTFTTVDSSSRYFVMVFTVIAMGISMMWKSDSRLMKSILIIVIMVWGISNYHRVYYPLMTDQSYKNSEYVKIGDYLLQKGYEYAYTNFDHANMITVINDGKIRVCAVDSFEKMNVCKWMTSEKWYVPNIEENMKTAYIISDYRLEEFEVFLREHSDVEYEVTIGGFHIYGSDVNYSRLAE